MTCWVRYLLQSLLSFLGFVFGLYNLDTGVTCNGKFHSNFGERRRSLASAGLVAVELRYWGAHQNVISAEFVKIALINFGVRGWRRNSRGHSK